MTYSNLKDIAPAVIQCGVSWEPEAKLIGNVSAKELVMLAAYVIEQISQPCPMCGSEPWVNIDCRLCTTCATFDDTD